MKLLKNNAPEILEKLAEKWLNLDKSFYLGPENMFLYDSQVISYAGDDNISKNEGDWFICTESQKVPQRELSKEEIEDISNILAEGLKSKSAIIYVDYKCNSKCHVCGYHGDDTKYYDDNFKSAKITVSLEKAKERIDKLFNFGIKKLCIVSNGEILVYKYWEELFRYAVSKGFSLGFNSNGFLLDEKRIKILADIGNISWVEVSLHSIDYNIWADFTGATNKKIFERVQEAPLLLKKYGITSCVAAVRTERTVKGLKDYLDYWIPRVSQVTIVNQINIDYFSNYQPNNSNPLGICNCARNCLYILPNGLVAPCSSFSCCTDDNRHGISIWNIDEMSLDDIDLEIKKAWEDKLFYEICARCPRRRITASEITKTSYGYKCFTEGMVHNRFTQELNKTQMLKVIKRHQR